MALRAAGASIARGVAGVASVVAGALRGAAHDGVPRAGGETTDGAGTAKHDAAKHDAAKDGAAKEAGAKDAAPTAPTGNPFADRNTQALSTLTWLVGALGAVATLMVAGTQLTSIGRLTWEDDRPRLLAAGIAVTVAVVLVLVAVGLLTWATMPPRLSDLERLDDLAATDAGGAVASSVARDSSYHRGTGSLPALLAALSDARARYYAAKARLTAAELEAAREDDDAARTGLDARAARLRAEVAVLGSRNDDLRLGARAAAHLDNHLRTRGRAVRVSWWVLATAAVVAVCLVVFAWAANPPEEPAGADAAVPPAPVAAVLLLASDEDVWDDRLGGDCAAAARGDGVAVVALAADDDAVTVLVLPGDDCADPVEVAVPRDEGTVTAEAVDVG